MIRRIIFIAILSFAIGYLYTEPLYTPTAILMSSQQMRFPSLIAHKSLVSGDYVGNTRAAIQEALASHIEGIKIDVRLSKDDILFIYHGETLEELTNGQGRPEDMTWAELEKLVYKNQASSSLIRLEQVFQDVGGQKYLFLDVKTAVLYNKQFAQQLIKLIRAYHLEETVIVESFNPGFLTLMRILARDILLMYDFAVNNQGISEENQKQFQDIPWLLRQPFIQKQIRRLVRPDILGPQWNLDENLLKLLIKAGYPVISWTVDEKDIAQHLLKLGVKGIQTNKSQYLMSLIPHASFTIYDAGGTKTQVTNIIHVQSTQDILKALTQAKNLKRSLTIAGRRHSMGGQTLYPESIHLDMMGFNAVRYDPKTQCVIVQPGATWRKVQHILDQHGRAVKVMQSDNIFTVGGSISVNAHGWQANEEPLASTVQSIKIIMANGQELLLSRHHEPELFNAVLGGYGQLGIITEITLCTVANSMLKFHVEILKPQDFSVRFYEKVTKNPYAELAYGRLSVDQDNLFKEVGLFWYEKIESQETLPMSHESLVALKRTVFRISQYTNLGKKLRWAAEKMIAHQQVKANAVSRNSVMNSDIHILWPLYGQNQDILHEYFIPKHRFVDFINVLKNLILHYGMNLLNVTIREVKQDHVSMLAYAQQDVFGFVLLFSQAQDRFDEYKMQTFTHDLIDHVLKLQGTFYLPYRLHWSSTQLVKAYPSLSKWLAIKNKWDPEHVFNSQFLRHLTQ